jgi:hypothetical protein
VTDQTAQPLSEGERLRAALRAEQELALTEACFDGLKIAMVNRLIATDFDEGAEREQLYHGLKALGSVRKALADMVKAGSDDRAMAQAAAEIAKAGER